MLPIQKILCPTDFSPASIRGVEVATEFGKHFSAEIVLIHVVSPIPVLPTPGGGAVFNIPSYQQEMESYARHQLQELIETRIGESASARTIVAIGDPADRITECAGDEKVDIIIMATHGETGWRRFISGSVTEKCVRLADIPVLTVHPSGNSE